MESHNSNFTPVLDTDGKFIYNASVYNSHHYCPFKNFTEKLEGYKRSFPVQDDDIYLLNYPKSGTHWTWEILMMLTRGSAAFRPEHKHEMMLETEFDSSVQKGEGRRIINAHYLYNDMPADILNNNRAKFIQVHRNPADVAVSFYHHGKKAVGGLALAYNWTDYIEKLFWDEAKMINSSWSNYTRDWWTHCSGNSNYLPVFYEELKENPVTTIEKITEFLEIKPKGGLIEQIVSQTSIEKMKEGKREGERIRLTHFTPNYSMYRKGVVGDWRNHFTKEQHERFMNHYNQELRNHPELHQRFLKYLRLS
ncbi:sulfotransferase 1B1-like isoform X2 [Watersipora subatra]